MGASDHRQKHVGSITSHVQQAPYTPPAGQQYESLASKDGIVVESRSKKNTTEEYIIETNNHCVVSKRSVERLYYDAPHLFRHFVSKPKRRSPLINRGYWLRMRAVEDRVRAFLGCVSEKQKMILNLGCGYDVLPFRILAKDPELCRNTTFIDIDYPKLIHEKVKIIRRTAQLHDLLDCVSTSTNTETILKSQNYIAIGCDLLDLNRLNQVLAEALDHEVSKCNFFCLAEASISYMEVERADALISWAASLGEASFCLLEQFFPNGPMHPFAIAMTKQLGMQNSPLKSIHNYPSLNDQRHRFCKAGWSSVEACSLWGFWSSMTPHERRRMDQVEAFDEWEELALFASHYFYLVASNNFKVPASDQEKLASILRPARVSLQPFPASERYSTGPSRPDDNVSAKAMCPRRFGALFRTQHDVYGHHGGCGENTPVNTTSVYTLDQGLQYSNNVPPLDIDARMCHTITTLEPSLDCLLVGGRKTPEHALGDCWLRRSGRWERVDDLPKPLYRHCATFVKDPNGVPGVLINGGKTNKEVATNDWFLWQDLVGWMKLDCGHHEIRPRFGAAMASVYHNRGVLLGGMVQDGMIATEIFAWEIDFITAPPRIRLLPMVNDDGENEISRFGATLSINDSEPRKLYLVGGISFQGIVPSAEDVYCLHPSKDLNTFTAKALLVHAPLDPWRPLFIGHASVWDGRGLAVVGGGAVCFSFGVCSNGASVWRVDDHATSQSNVWQNEDVSSEAGSDGLTAKGARLIRGAGVHEVGTWQAPAAVNRVKIPNEANFKRIVNQGKPTLIEGLSLGSCSHKWTTEYLKSTVVAANGVVVHQATKDNMNFQRKDFDYVTKSFATFMDEVAGGGRLYLRSLSLQKPADQPANFARDYAELANDFQCPVELGHVMEHFHSSVLRISGPVTMWLHYDVMANILCQIRGTKRMLLYPPSDVLQLGLPHGQSSSTFDVFDPAVGRNGALPNTEAREVMLKPGDVLFIPPLWCHTASPSDSIGSSIAINIFFRDLGEEHYAAGRDVYGNRDLQAYEDGRKGVAQLARKFEGLPAAVRRFYLKRLTAELADLSSSFS